MHFLEDDKTEGKQKMAQSWEHIHTELSRVLEKDKKIRQDAFDETLTAQKFVDLVFSLVISALVCQNYDGSGVLALIRRIIYVSSAH